MFAAWSRLLTFDLYSFHDPEQDSVFAHSSSVKAFAKWSLATKGGSGTTTPIAEDDATSKILVKTEKGDQYLPSLVTPRSAQGKRIQ
jgi:lysophospholipase